MEWLNPTSVTKKIVAFLHDSTAWDRDMTWSFEAVKLSIPSPRAKWWTGLDFVHWSSDFRSMVPSHASHTASKVTVVGSHARTGTTFKHESAVGANSIEVMGCATLAVATAHGIWIRSNVECRAFPRDTWHRAQFTQVEALKARDTVSGQPSKQFDRTTLMILSLHIAPRNDRWSAFSWAEINKAQKNQKLDFLLLSLSWAYLDIFAR